MPPCTAGDAPPSKGQPSSSCPSRLDVGRSSCFVGGETEVQKVLPTGVSVLTHSFIPELVTSAETGD